MGASEGNASLSESMILLRLGCKNKSGGFAEGAKSGGQSQAVKVSGMALAPLPFLTTEGNSAQVMCSSATKVKSGRLFERQTVCLILNRCKSV